MRVLLVKLSSLGDVVHTLPALSDAHQALPNIVFDWAIEPAFALIAAAHPAVARVIETPLRRWRRAPIAARSEIVSWRARLNEHSYDLVLDAQGLVKSAVVASLARGPRVGFDVASAREPLASLSYAARIKVPRERHAIDRLRQLFAAALDYSQPSTAERFGLERPVRPTEAPERFALLLPGTTWTSKHWPLAQWRALCAALAERGLQVLVAHSDASERSQAEAIVQGVTGAALLPPQSIAGLLAWLGHAQVVVAVDTGLGHLAAALGTVSVLLYGPTSAQLTGARGSRALDLLVDFPCAPCRQRHCARVSAGPSPCFDTLPASRVLAAIDVAMRDGVS